MKILPILTTVTAFLSQPVLAEDCSQIKDKTIRLACYDRAQKKVSNTCPHFEQKSNALLDRFAISFQHVSELRPILSELLTEFNECKTKSSNTAQFQRYAINIQVFLAVNDVWGNGIRICENISHIVNDCDWKKMNDDIYIKQLKTRYPAIENLTARNYGDFARGALDLVSWF